jgi:NAD(P)-dependent dehydrogenase (short-subunit alcohol dehydrogenase family)
VTLSAFHRDVGKNVSGISTRRLKSQKTRLDAKTPGRTKLMEAKMAGRVKGKVVIITGAGTGVGNACMKLFASEGAKVVGVGRTLATLEDTMAEVRKAGGEGFIIPADLSEDDAAQRIIQQTVKKYGRVDILVHAAGVGYSWGEKSPGSMNNVVETPPDKWREVISINLDAFYLMCRAVVPQMQSQGGGSIVAVASISGMQGMQVAHAYTAAKGGMINLVRSICTAYAKDNIRANCVSPGFTATPMIASVLNLFDDPVVADQITPMRRPGTPEEMAYGCLYMGSDEASYCNGSNLVIDGGTTARQ